MAVLFLALVAAAPARAADDEADADRIRFTLGLKLWYNNWETWGPTERSDTKLAWIPSVSASYRDYFASFSYFTKTRYNFPASFGNVDRREMDLSAGKWVLQGEGGRLGVLVGYKDVKQKFTAFDEAITAPFVGFTGAAHVAGPWSLYMSGAYGRATETGPGFKATGYYMSGEAGVAYSFARSAVLTAGYKVQIIDVGNGSCGVGRCRDSTDGFIVGVSQTF